LIILLAIQGKSFGQGEKSQENIIKNACTI
jgi:hypothetical protein